MEDDIIILKCNNCGEEFLYQTHKGKGCKNLPKYCETCKVQKIKEYKETYRQKQKEKKKAENERIGKIAKLYHEEEFAETIEEGEEVVVDKYTEFINKISKLLMTLDTTRVELCDLHKQMSEYQSAYDKSDQTYLHKMENIDTENFAELQRFMVEWKMSRGARRNIKDLVLLVSNLLDTIPVKNYSSALPVLKGSAYLKKENGNGIMSMRGYANEKNRR